jgi:hypothetical protein
MVDALADLGEPINDRTLVLNILCDLNERFQFMSQLVTRQRPFPSFVDVRIDLRLAELNMAPPSAPPLALVASSSSKPPALLSPFGPAPPCPPPPQTTGGASSGSVRGRHRHGGHGQGGSHDGSPGRSQWPSLLNSWTGSIHMWLGSTPGGPRGPLPHASPPSSLQQALVTSVPLAS